MEQSSGEAGAKIRSIRIHPRRARDGQVIPASELSANGSARLKHLLDTEGGQEGSMN